MAPSRDGGSLAERALAALPAAQAIGARLPPRRCGNKLSPSDPPPAPRARPGDRGTSAAQHILETCPAHHVNEMVAEAALSQVNADRICAAYAHEDLLDQLRVVMVQRSSSCERAARAHALPTPLPQLVAPLALGEPADAKEDVSDLMWLVAVVAQPSDAHRRAERMATMATTVPALVGCLPAPNVLEAGFMLG